MNELDSSANLDVWANTGAWMQAVKAKTAPKHVLINTFDTGDPKRKIKKIARRAQPRADAKPFTENPASRPGYRGENEEFAPNKMRGRRHVGRNVYAAVDIAFDAPAITELQLPINESKFVTYEETNEYFIITAISALLLLTRSILYFIGSRSNNIKHFFEFFLSLTLLND